MEKIKVLYIEDEPNLATIVRETMELKGFEVLHLEDGRDVLDKIAIFRPDICILDVMLPYTDGFSIGEAIRKEYMQLPVIFLTAKGQTTDVLRGFSSGGTDYIKKPFSLEELIARVHNQLALHRQAETLIADNQASDTCRLGTFVYYPLRLELQAAAGVIKLSNREAEVLNELCRHINIPIERRDLMKAIWNDDSYFISRNLDVYIKKLRTYFETGRGVSIITLKGRGYLFSVDNQNL